MEAKKRGVDYGRHNADCIRFCDAKEEGLDTSKANDCATRMCHQPPQLPSDWTPIPIGSEKNCEQLKCNLLTIDELSLSRLTTAASTDADGDSIYKKYCDSSIKCLEFDATKLVKTRVDVLCQLHTCDPPDGTTSIAEQCKSDDISKISQNLDYKTAYIHFTLGDQALNQLCIPLTTCKPVVYRQYRCTATEYVNETTNKEVISGDDNKDYNLNKECDGYTTNPTIPFCSDVTGGSVNYCIKTIDCNLTKNKTESECRESVPDSIASTAKDPFESWFYRPKPMDKSINSNGVLLSMDNGDNNRLCYQVRDMRDHDWGTKFWIFGSGWYHNYLEHRTRSPGTCRGPHHGARGIGYAFLCGTKGNLYSPPQEYATYFEGPAIADFSSTVTKYKVRVCTRFENTMTFSGANKQTCGGRECGITAIKTPGISSRVDGQTCGGDVCRDLLILEGDDKECMMTNSLAWNNSDKRCSAFIDDFGSTSYIRVRAVKYRHNICAFLDSKGQLAYRPYNFYMNGRERLTNGTKCKKTDASGNCSEYEPGSCVNDTGSVPGSDNSCNGYNSNSNEGTASTWRAVQQTRYVDNNRPASETRKGYLDRGGRLHKEQECPKIPLKIAPGDQYNLATIINSPKLFSPGVRIINVKQARGKNDAPIPAGADYGTTDFNTPEIEIKFGSSYYKMSLIEDEVSGNEDRPGNPKNTDPSSPSSLTATTSFSGRSFSADLFVKKEYDSSNNPLVCLYHRFKDENGSYLAPVRSGCVSREKPSITNSAFRLSNSSFPPRKFLVYPSSEMKYNSAEVAFRYLTGFGANETDNGCGLDDNCTKEINIKNEDYKEETCDDKSEGYTICARRDVCTRLNIDCVKNEIDINNARINGGNLTTFFGIRSECNNTALPSCNALKGISSNSLATIYNQNPANVAGDETRYGWFNEICIVSGLEASAKKILALQTKSGVKGKCVINANSPHLTDSSSSTNCNSGGKPPGCLCVDFVDGFIPDEGYEARGATPRELGLCVDIPLPASCRIIDYNLNPNQDTNDLEYIATSLGKNSYCNGSEQNCVHQSHQYRTSGKSDPDGIPLYGHGEFPITFAGSNDIEGECKGFWTYQKNAFGINLTPKLSCLTGANSTANWDSTIKNACVRYSCPQVITFGPDQNGVYGNSYDTLESGENRGIFNGFAIWNKFTKTNDFIENVQASSCIYGFKPLGSAPIKDATNTITSYSGGILPTRQCNQLGVLFSASANLCQRIQCPAINPAEPLSSSDSTAWRTWYNNGGATFQATSASRSNIRIQAESIATGTCNEKLGFYQGGNPPTRKCDYLGNWSDVENSCVTACSPISDEDEASTINNGFAKWTVSPISDPATGEKSGIFGGCVSGYLANPYPPSKDVHGNLLALTNDLTRPASNPERICKPAIPISGGTRCLGFSDDPRVGVGKTVHQTSVGLANIAWPVTQAGSDAFASNWSINNPETSLNASYFSQGRANGVYLIKRHCGTNGVWEEPKAACSLNQGAVGNATYTISGKTGYANSIESESEDEAQGICLVNYWSYGSTWHSNGAPPKRQCVFEQGNYYIDKVYLKLVNSYFDCEKIICRISDYPTFSCDSSLCSPFTTAFSCSSTSCKTNFVDKNISFQNTDITIGQQLNGLSCVFQNGSLTNSSGQTLSPDQFRNNYITCGSDGLFRFNTDSSLVGSSDKISYEIGTSPFYSASICKKSCIIGTGAVGTTQNCGTVESHGQGVSYCFKTFQMKHGEEVQFTAFIEEQRDCRGWNFVAKCDDGNLVYPTTNPSGVSMSYDTGNMYGAPNQMSRYWMSWTPFTANCRTSKYNFSTNSWEASQSLPLGDYIHYDDQTYFDQNGNSQTLSVY
jgi:hypothetical protein